MSNYDVIIVGGGLVGIAIAYGLSRTGQRVAVLDQGDTALRAARGNFGLIWVQGKGDGCPQYAQWTRLSADRWQLFNHDLESESGLSTGYSRPGGLDLCLTEEEYTSRADLLARLVDQSDGKFKGMMLRPKALTTIAPGLGKEVVGASFSPMDGHVNPLQLLRALHKAFKNAGGELRIETVVDIQAAQSGFKLITAQNHLCATKIVLAAGLGNRDLASKVGMNVPVRPQRGQILVTERLKPFLTLPTSLVRQTVEGSVLLGDSHEEVGFDDGTQVNIMAEIADRARAIFPHLESARIVRAWGALRILAPDGLPIYDQSPEFPGAFTASSHSGVTLAAAHALEFSRYIAQGKLPASLDDLSARRFHVH